MVYGNGGETQQVWLDLGLLTHVELRGATQHHLPQFSNFCWRPFPVVCVAFLTHISQQKHNITQLYIRGIRPPCHVYMPSFKTLNHSGVVCHSGAENPMFVFTPKNKSVLQMFPLKQV